MAKRSERKQPPLYSAQGGGSLSRDKHRKKGVSKTPPPRLQSYNQMGFNFQSRDLGGEGGGLAFQDSTQG